MSNSPSDPSLSAWRMALWITVALTAVRLAAIFITPLELYPDEAQYWLWSRTLDFGYFSKPPMVAWSIWATTLGSDAEPFVRLSAPLFQATTALGVFILARRLYGAEVGLAACVLYHLMPGVQLSSAVVATDAPLLAALVWALALYVYLPQAEGRRRWVAAGGAGVLLGLAFLSKYAAIYALIGVGLHLVLSREARRVWTPGVIAAAAGAALLVMAPNLIWNARHGFSTVTHTAANANWRASDLFHPGAMLEFLGSQFGVFGPIPFAVLVGGAVLLAWRRRLTAADITLLCFALPPFLIVTLQALLSRANANWTAAGYVAGVILVAAWLLRWRARGWFIAALATQGVLAAAFLAFVISPDLAERAGMANGFKRAKGWSQMTEALTNRAMHDLRVSAIAVDDRFMFNAAAYYGRNYFARPDAAPLRMWVRTASPQNQAEAETPLSSADGERILALSLEPDFTPEMKADFATVGEVEFVNVRLDRERSRRAEIFVGEGFAPQPRDPVTGLPIRP
ncbi:ArnT family glycosyltransferase [Phenylobacterium sp.]|uniref:ArnT family glycosyltransferase n=1 Tax=Phenylobacterium sp. TaxID=1871053 RepID=UPI00351DE32F